MEDGWAPVDSGRNGRSTDKSAPRKELFDLEREVERERLARKRLDASEMSLHQQRSHTSIPRMQGMETQALQQECVRLNQALESTLLAKNEVSRRYEALEVALLKERKYWESQVEDLSRQVKDFQTSQQLLQEDNGSLERENVLFRSIIAEMQASLRAKSSAKGVAGQSQAEVQSRMQQSSLSMPLSLSDLAEDAPEAEDSWVREVTASLQNLIQDFKGIAAPRSSEGIREMVQEAFERTSREGEGGRRATAQPGTRPFDRDNVLGKALPLSSSSASEKKTMLLEHDLSASKRECSNWRQQYEEAKEASEQAEARLQQTLEELAGLKHQHESVTARFNELSTACLDVCRDVKDAAHRPVKELLIDLKRSLYQAEADNRELRIHQEQLLRRNEELALNARHTSKLEQSVAALQAKLAALDAVAEEAKALKEEKMELERQLESLQAEDGAAKANADSQERKRLAEETEHLKNSNDQMHSRLNAEIDANRRLKADLATCKRQLENLQTLLDGKEEQFLSASQLNMKREQEIASLRKELSQAAHMRNVGEGQETNPDSTKGSFKPGSTFDSSTMVQEEQNRQLQQQVSALQERISSLADSERALKQQKSSLEAQSEALEAELERLKKADNRHCAEEDRLRRELEEARTSVEVLRQQLEKTGKGSNAKSSEEMVSSLRSTIQRLEQELREQNVTISELRFQVGKLEGQKEGHESTSRLQKEHYEEKLQEAERVRLRLAADLKEQRDAHNLQVESLERRYNGLASAKEGLEKKLEDLQRELHESQRECRNLEVKVSEGQGEGQVGAAMKELATRYDALMEDGRQENRRLQQRVDSLMRDIAELQERRKDDQVELQQLSAQVEAAQQAAQETANEKQALQDKVTRQSHSLEELQAELRSTESRLAEVVASKEYADAASKEKEVLQQQLVEEQRKIKQQDEELQQTKAIIRELETTHQSLTEKAAEYQREYEALAASVSEKQADEAKSVAKLQQRLAEAEAKVEELTSKLSRAEIGKEIAEQHARRAGDEKTRSASDAHALKEQLKAVTSELEQARTDVTGLENRCRSLQQDYAALQASFEALQDDKQNAEELDAELTAAKDELRDAREKNAALENELGDLNSQYEALQHKYKEEQGVRRTGEELAEQLKIQVEQLTVQQTEASQQLEEYKTKVAGLEDANNQLQETLEEANQGRALAEEEATTLGDESGRLRHTLSDVEATLSQREQSLQEAESRLKQLSHELEETARKYNEVEEAFRAKSGEVEELNSKLQAKSDQAADFQAQANASSAAINNCITELFPDSESVEGSDELFDRLLSGIKLLRQQVSDSSAEVEKLQAELQSLQAKYDTIRNSLWAFVQTMDGAPGLWGTAPQEGENTKPSSDEDQLKILRIENGLQVALAGFRALNSSNRLLKENERTAREEISRLKTELEASEKRFEVAWTATQALQESTELRNSMRSSPSKAEGSTPLSTPPRASPPIPRSAMKHGTQRLSMDDLAFENNGDLPHPSSHHVSSATSPSRPPPQAPGALPTPDHRGTKPRSSSVQRVRFSSPPASPYVSVVGFRKHSTPASSTTPPLAFPSDYRTPPSRAAKLPLASRTEMPKRSSSNFRATDRLRQATTGLKVGGSDTEFTRLRLGSQQLFSKALSIDSNPNNSSK